MSGRSCAIVVMLSLVTFNVPIDVLSTRQRGHGLRGGRSKNECVYVCLKKRKNGMKEGRRHAAKASEYQCRLDSLLCEAHKCGLAWFSTSPFDTKHCKAHRWPLVNLKRGE